MAVPFVALPAAAPLFGPEAALVGAGVGLLVGLTSMGAGALLTPALVLLLGVPPRIAVGSDVLIAGVMKLFGGGADAGRRARPSAAPPRPRPRAPPRPPARLALPRP